MVGVSIHLLGGGGDGLGLMCEYLLGEGGLIVRNGLCLFLHKVGKSESQSIHLFQYVEYCRCCLCF